jgi:hypothetical protein
MARGDPVFTKFDNAVRHSRKVHQLRPDERWVYVVLNMLCTELRQDVLLGEHSQPACGTAEAHVSLSYLAAEAHVDVRIALRSLRHMAEVRVIELTNKWSVFVYDVRDRHNKLRWKTRPIWPPNGETLIPQTRPENASLQRSENRDIYPESECTTGPAVDRLPNRRISRQGEAGEETTKGPLAPIVEDVLQMLGVPTCADTRVRAREDDNHKEARE